MTPAFKKYFELTADDIVELTTKNDALKIKIGAYNGKWLHDSKRKLLKEIDDEKRANLNITRMKKKTDEKTFKKWLILVIKIYGKPNLVTSFQKEISCKI